jgi:hypothetical protein
VDKASRTALFLDQLVRAEPCASAEEALVCVAFHMNAVEDRYTTTQYNPEQWQSDGRLYPPQPDMRRATAHPQVARYRSRKHNTWIAENGAIKITEAEGNKVCLDKPGADGMTVSFLMANVALTR